MVSQRRHDTLSNDPIEERLRQGIQAAVREHERLVVVWQIATARAKTGAPGSRHAEQDAAHAADKASRDVDERVRQLLVHCRSRRCKGE